MGQVRPSVAEQLERRTLLSAGLNAPSNLLARETANLTALLSWRDDSTAEDHYAIERSTDGGAFETIITAPVNTTRFRVRGLAAQHSYTFKVQAVDAQGLAQDSRPAHLMPMPVTNVSLVERESGEVTLNWTDASQLNSGYEIWVESDPGFKRVGNVGPNETSLDVHGLVDGRYFLRVRPITDRARGTFSDGLAYSFGFLFFGDPLPADGSSSADLVIEGFDAEVEEFGSFLIENANHDEANHDANGNAIPDNQPDELAGDRIVRNDRELASAWIFVRQRDDQTGSFTLDIPDDVRVWRQFGGSWREMHSDQPSEIFRGESVVLLKVEGVRATPVTEDGQQIQPLDQLLLTWTRAGADASSPPWSDTVGMFVAPYDIPSPTDVRASFTDRGLVKIDWQPLNFRYGYHLYRSVDGGARFAELQLDYTFNNDAGRFELIDPDVPRGRKLIYRVTAEDHHGDLRESAPSPVVMIDVPRDDAPPAPPTSLQDKSDKFGVKVSWSASPSNDVARYELSQRIETEFEALNSYDRDRGEFNWNDSDLVGGETVTYRVVAVDYAGNESAAAEITIVPPPFDSDPPAVPKNVRVERQSDGTFIVSWDANADADLAGYSIYVSDRITDGYLLAAQQVGLATSFHDTDPPSPTQSFYRVSAFDDVGNESGHVGPDVTPPAVPQNVRAVASEDGIVLTWDPVSDTDIYRYHVSYASSSGPLAVVPAPGTSALIRDATPGALSSFKVEAVDTSNNRSALSETTSAIRPMLAPDPPSVGVASATQVNLHWLGFHGDRSYDVYRGTTPDFTPSADARIAAGFDRTRFIDRNPPAGWSKLYYRLVARGDEIRSPRSASAVADLSLGQIPNAPTFLGYFISEGNVNLRWDQALNELGYLIDQYNPTKKKWQRFATAPVGSYNYKFSAADITSPRRYRVHAYNAFGESTPFQTRVDPSGGG